MKILTDLKCKFPCISFCYNNKCVMVRYWGGLKFDKVVVYGQSEQSCGGNCGMNYCDTNGCIDRKRILTEPKPPEDCI